MVYAKCSLHTAYAFRKQTVDCCDFGQFFLMIPEILRVAVMDRITGHNEAQSRWISEHSGRINTQYTQHVVAVSNICASMNGRVPPARDALGSLLSGFSGLEGDVLGRPKTMQDQKKKLQGW